MSKFTDFETEILGSIENAYAEDPSPESGRTYIETELSDDDEHEGEEPYKVAMGLKNKGLLRFVENGKIKTGTFKGKKFVHFGLTDAGFKLTEELFA